MTASLPPRLGGPSKVAVEMCEALAARDVEVTLFSTNLDERGRWSPLASPATMPVPTDRSTLIKGVERRYFETSWPSAWAFSPEMEQALRKRTAEFDLVHVHSLYLFTTLVACHYALRRGIPYLIRPHGTLDPYLRRRHTPRKAVYDRLLQRRQLDRAAAMHFTSREELELVKPLGISAPGVVMPPGVNLDEFRELPEKGTFRALRPELKDKRLVVFLGRVTQKKGLDLLVSAFASVAREVSDAHLVIAGPDDDGYGKTVSRWLAEMQVQHRSTMTGLLLGREKLALLADTDVWVLPSYTENFGVAVVEAMACGLPVVISDRVNIHREVANAGAGLVVSCEATDVANGILRVLRDAEFGNRLASAAVELVRRQFTWDSATSRLVDVYQALCHRPRVAHLREAL